MLKAFDKISETKLRSMLGNDYTRVKSALQHLSKNEIDPGLTHELVRFAVKHKALSAALSALGLHEAKRVYDFVTGS